MRRRFPITTAMALVAMLLTFAGPPDVHAADDLAKAVAPLIEALSGQADHFALEADLEITVIGRSQRGWIRLVRYDETSFELSLDHDIYGFRLVRMPEQTALILPHHQIAFIGRGEASEHDHLVPEGLLARLVSDGTAVRPWLEMVTSAQSQTNLPLLLRFADVRRGPDGVWRSEALRGLTLRSQEGPGSLDIAYQDHRIRLQWQPQSADVPAPGDELPEGYEAYAVDRAELERMVLRGARRALEVLAPAPIAASKENVEVEHGRLEWFEGQRIVTLWGTPAQIGQAQGLLLAEPIFACVDSTVYMVGLARTMHEGRWLPDVLREAHDRLEPFIPPAHLTEMDAIADAVGLDRMTLRLANVFPELFHCSGFALFGTATEGGTLYHGRVLDYMSLIGLHEAAAIFIVHGDGEDKIPFVNIGYAGFVGSVTGMNAEQISLGEMGGAGEGDWDGVPMASLMRLALETCSTLDEIKQLWAESPRTCEYYYVFADGKGPGAAGVAATPDAITFIGPGEAHPLLGEGFADAVVLSAGDRLSTLRDRVSEHHGSIDAQTALWLMSRPVSMRSNLHNVLFLPQSLALYVSHADGTTPAADLPYVRLELAERLQSPLPPVETDR